MTLYDFIAMDERSRQKPFGVVYISQTGMMVSIRFYFTRSTAKNPFTWRLTIIKN
jgi:hypothetical protein